AQASTSEAGVLMAAAMQYESETVPEQDFYTVDRLRFLLSIYPTLGFSQPPKDPEVRVKIMRLLGEASWAEASVKAADIEQALRWLNAKKWEVAFVIRASCIVGLTQEVIKGYLAREGVVVHPSTIGRWERDGLANMCDWLNGRMP